MQDLTCESLFENLKNYKKMHARLSSWETLNAFSPSNKFFATKEEKDDSIQKRLNFLHVLEKTAKKSGLFVVTDSFSRDFVYRND
jgi:hypothetical protein